MGKRRNREFETDKRRGRVSGPDPDGRRMSQTLLSGGLRESESSALGKFQWNNLLAQNPNLELDRSPSPYRSGEDSRSRAMPMPAQGIGSGGFGYCQIQNVGVSHEMVHGSIGRGGVYRQNLCLEGEFNREMEMAAGHHAAYSQAQLLPRVNEVEDPRWAHQEDMLLDLLYKKMGGAGGDLMTSSYLTPTIVERGVGGNVRAGGPQENCRLGQYHDDFAHVLPTSYHYISEPTVPSYDQLLASSNSTTDAIWNRDTRGLDVEPLSYQDTHLPEDDQSLLDAYGGSQRRLEEAKDLACLTPLKRWALKKKEQLNGNHSKSKFFHPFTSCLGVPNYGDHLLNTEGMEQSAVHANYGEDEWNNEPNATFGGDQINSGQGLMPGEDQYNVAERVDQRNNDNRVTNCAEPQWRAYQWNADRVIEKLNADRLLPSPGLPGSMQAHYGKQSKSARVHVKERLGPLRSSVKTRLGPANSHGRVKLRLGPAQIDPDLNISRKTDDYSGSSHPQRVCLPKVKKDALIGSIYPQRSARAQVKSDYSGSIHPQKGAPKKVKTDAVTGTIQTDAVTPTIHPLKAGPQKIKIDAVIGGIQLQKGGPKKVMTDADAVTLTGSILPRKARPKKVKIDAITRSTHPPGSALQQVKPDDFSGSNHPQRAGLPEVKIDAAKGSTPLQVKPDDFSGSIHPQKVGRRKLKRDAVTGSSHPQGSVLLQVKTNSFDGSIHPEECGLPKPKTDGGFHPEGSALPNVKTNDFSGSIHPQRAGLPEVKIDAASGSTHSQESAPPQVKPDDSSGSIHPQKDDLPEFKIDAATGSTQSQGSAAPQVKPDDFSGSIHPQRAGLPEVKIDAATGSTHSHSQGNAPPQVKPDDFSGSIHPQRADLPEVKKDSATTHSPGSAPPQFKPDDFSGSIHPQRVGLPEVKIDTGNTHSQGSAPPQEKPDDFSGRIYPTKAGHRKLKRDAVTGSNYPQRAGLAEVKKDAAIGSTYSQGCAPLQVKSDDFSGSIHLQRVGLPEVKLDTGSTHSQGSAPPQVRPDDFSGSIHPKAGRRKLKRDAVTGSNNPQRAGIAEVKIDAAIGSTHSQGSVPPQVKLDDSSGSIHPQKAGLRKLKRDAFTGITHPQASVKTDTFDGSIHPEEGGLSKLKTDGGIHPEGSALPNVKTNDISGSIGPEGDSLSKRTRKGAKKTSPEETEEFKKLVDTAFLKFVNILVENPNQMKKGQCCVCASSEEFVGTEPLAIHAFMSPMVGLRADHLGFHRAVCVLFGWDSTAVLNGMWVPRSLPTAEALALKEDLVIWPPVVVIHNSSMSNKFSEDERLMLNVDELEDILTDIGFGRETCKVYRGKPADLSIMVAKFNPTFPGLLEAERLQSFFIDNQHGKAEWQTFSDVVLSNNRSAKEALLADKEHILYGYLGTAEDWGKLDLEGMKRLVVKSKKEMKAIANASI